MSSEPVQVFGRPPSPLGVVVAHRRPADLDSLVRWLSADDRFTVSAAANDTTALMEAVTAANPAVALVDLELGGVRTGIQAIADLRDVHPAVRVVAVADADDDRAYAALRAGAVGLYLWSDPVSPVSNVVAGVARGEGVLTPGWAGRLLDEVGWLTRESSPLRAPELTPTELEVVRRVASGATAAAVAALHGVTEHLVNVHAGIVVTKVFRHHDDSRRLGLTPA